MTILILAIIILGLYCIIMQQPIATTLGFTPSMTTMYSGSQHLQNVRRLFFLIKTAYNHLQTHLASLRTLIRYEYDTPRRLSQDAKGNISEYIDLSDGTITAHYEYDAFGQQTVSTGTAPCSFGFSSKCLDKETDLLYYGFRYYDPGNGRWLNRDPIGIRGGINLYSFVKNLGVSLVDPLGLNCQSVIRYAHYTDRTDPETGETLPGNRSHADEQLENPQDSCGVHYGYQGCGANELNSPSNNPNPITGMPINDGSPPDDLNSPENSDIPRPPGPRDWTDSGASFEQMIAGINAAKSGAPGRCNKAPHCCTTITVTVECPHGDQAPTYDPVTHAYGAPEQCGKSSEYDCESASWSGDL